MINVLMSVSEGETARGGGGVSVFRPLFVSPTGTKDGLVVHMQCQKQGICSAIASTLIYYSRLTEHFDSHAGAELDIPEAGLA